MKSERKNLLVEKLLSRTATPAEIDELNQWYQDSYQADIEWNHSDINEKNNLKKRLLKNIQRQIRAEYSVQTKIFSTAKLLGVTAAACLIVGIFIVFKVIKDHQVSFISINAAKGQIENTFVLLPDSSKIILRSGSKIQYHYSDTLREIYLSGDGFFEVTKNQKRPFLVHAGEITTRVLGTSFSVESNSNRPTRVFVKSGKVAIQNKQQHTLVTLTPNQGINYDTDKNTIQKTILVSDNELDWVNRDMQFTDVPFGRLIENLKRRYHSEIIFENEELKNCLLTGYFKGTESLTEVLDILTKTTGASFNLIGSTFVLQGSGCIKQTN